MWEKKISTKNSSKILVCSENNYQIFQIGWIPRGFSHGKQCILGVNVHVCMHPHTCTQTHRHTRLQAKFTFYPQPRGGWGKRRRRQSGIFSNYYLRALPRGERPFLCCWWQYTLILSIPLPPLSIDLRGSDCLFEQYLYPKHSDKQKYGAHEMDDNRHPLLS